MGSRMKEENELIFTAVNIKGHCPVYDLGERTIIKGAEIDLGRSDCVCIHALFSLGTFIVALREGIPPHELGLAKEEGEKGHFQCLDPGKTLTEGGTVTFEITQVRG